jgi:CheY-like chemotaxis protein/nitrogen-specific signal transduction histidine kinase/HPt (histidine-containing phosphotransfer) domain-containing protein
MKRDDDISMLQKKLDKMEEKYFKSTESRLALSHLLTKVNRELEESLQNEKRFIASISHELRTPMTAIIGYSELLDDTLLDSKQRRYLSSITQSSDHLLALISDLLDISKLEDSRVELSLKEFYLDDILNECACLIRSKISDAVKFNVDIPLLDYPIISDEKRVKQIFINLLSNSVKFTDSGSIDFYIKSIDELDGGEVRFVINVDDTGSGIPDDIVDKIFDSFKTTDRVQGTGLGLYISQQLSRLMGGEISVYSKFGDGSSFSVEIVVEKSTKRRVGENLKDANIIIFSEKNEFFDRVFMEFMRYGVSFKNFNNRDSDIASILSQIVSSSSRCDIAIFDLDIFKKYTYCIAGTLKVLNPSTRLILLAEHESDQNIENFDKVIYQPIHYQKFIQYIEDIYTNRSLSAQSDIDYSHLNILIVEDVELNREYQREMLKSFFSIVSDTAVNGLEAVEKVRNNHYDAILMDMRMPIMDGIEATREIRKFQKDIPIVCMSANVYKEDKIAAENAGMIDFIEKPLERQDIEDKLLKHILNRVSLDIVDKTTIDIKQIALGYLQKSFTSDIADRLLDRAIANIKEYIDRIEDHITTGDLRELVEDFHALKGLCANIGLMDIARQLQELQELSEGDELSIIIDKKQRVISDLYPLVR